MADAISDGDGDVPQNVLRALVQMTTAGTMREWRETRLNAKEGEPIGDPSKRFQRDYRATG